MSRGAAVPAVLLLLAALFPAALVPAALLPSGAPIGSALPAEFDLQAHRGGRGETTEESLAAFANSLESGVSTLEFDVVLTADEQPAIWHDPVIAPAKCTDTAPVVPGDPLFPYVGRAVGKLTLAQLRTLDCGRPLPEFPDAQVVRHNRIATLAEVFALTADYRADVRYNIETKTDPAGDPQRIVAVILAAVRSAGRLDRVAIQSFDWRTLPPVRRAAPAVPLVALWEQPGDPIPGAVALGADVISPDYPMVDRAFVARAHAAGLAVIPWTVNDPAAMRTQIGFGVDGLITDYPTRLRAVLAELGMPLPPAFRRG